MPAIGEGTTSMLKDTNCPKSARIKCGMEDGQAKYKNTTWDYFR